MAHSADAVRNFSLQNSTLPTGIWRWAAVFFGFASIAAGVVAVAEPAAAHWLGIALLLGIATLASLLLFALWPRQGLSMGEARRVAEAAAKANVAWVVTGPDGAVLDCNEVYRRMAGTGANDAPPPPELALAAESSSAMLYRLSRAALEGKSREESFRAAPGLEIVAAVRPLASGQAAWWFTPRLGGVDTASSHSEAETAALPVQLQPAALFRDAPVGVAMAEKDGRVVEANRAFAEFFGLSSVAVGRSIVDLIDPADRSALGERLESASEAPHPPIEFRPAGNSDRMGELFVNSAGAEGRIILYLIDVSEQKALETKFAQSQKMQAVGQLAGGVAHDFNNLLTVIIGNSEFLLMRHAAGDPSFKEINEIHQNALRAANLVRQLLAFSRKQTLQPRVLALREAVGELGQLLRRLVGEGIDVELEYGADLWPVHADEAQLSNAIINLVVNARDAMPKGGKVVIRSENESVVSPLALGSAIMPSGDYVRIEIADTGVGIPKEHIGKIFDPFFTTKPVGQGTGLGLATVYGIVKQTGGFITVDSEPGKGTTFRIYLPRHRGEAPIVEPERAIPRDVTGEDTILLVEDEEAVRSFAARALKLRGYNVLEASGGEEALEIVKNAQSPIDLLITDVVMPNMDGPTLVRAVKRIRPAMAVIFMSGYAEEAFRRNDEKAEDLHFLPKPFGLKQLAAKVKDVLAAHAPAHRAG